MPYKGVTIAYIWRDCSVSRRYGKELLKTEEVTKWQRARSRILTQNVK